ncbi:MAG TPA: flavin reductase [Nevskiaceae bacterium]|nr:flavin reductase [Nevskiaceae bacterium]
MRFREALGSFATGVAIVTTRAPDGQPLGLTINSFNSVSLDPPLVLWSLAKNAYSLPVFRAAPHWAVHVLAADQDALSARFARRGEDKFGGLDLEEGLGCVPLLRGCSARFQCRTTSQYEGGDHVILIGEVLAFDRVESAPLVFHRGRYAHATRRDPSEGHPRVGHLAGSFSEDFVGYLLGRSHFRFFSQIRPYLDEAGLTDMEFYVMSALTLRPRLSTRQMAATMQGVRADQNRQQALAALAERGFARIDEGPRGSVYALTASGRELALNLISAAKAVESQVLERLGPADSAVLKALLNRLLGALDDSGANAIWSTREDEETTVAKS